MTDSPNPSPPNRRFAGASIFAATVVITGAVAVTAWSADRRLAEVAGRLDSIDRRLRLMQLEAGVKGHGAGALLEQIQFWCPQLESGRIPMPQIEWVESRLNEVLDAFETLGPSAYPQVLVALEDKSTGDEQSKWLLRAAYRTDPTRAVPLYESVLRGTRLEPSSRLRFLAADDLTRIDERIAGEALKSVLEIESHRGISRPIPAGLVPEYERVIGTNQFPDFFQLIQRLVATHHPDTEQVLLMILGRAEHDRMTYQECIRELATLHSKQAVGRIKKLYEEPPSHDYNPLFLNVCLQAIADIEGPAACDWLTLQMQTQQDPLVASRIRELIKQHCG